MQEHKCYPSAFGYYDLNRNAQLTLTKSLRIYLEDLGQSGTPLAVMKPLIAETLSDKIITINYAKMIKMFHLKYSKTGRNWANILINITLVLKTIHLERHLEMN